MSAELKITRNHTPDEDRLAFTDQNGISEIFNPGSGTLTLTGRATVDQYEAALRSVTYDNTSEHPSLLTRTVTCSVVDESSSQAGGELTGTATRRLTISALNDAPSINVNETRLTIRTGDTPRAGSSHKLP